jgi:simple sugar transport system permease protein
MTVETVPRTAQDERLATVGTVARALQRPEIGSLLGVVAVFTLFVVTANGFSETGFGSVTGAARWTDEASNIGIMAVPVALLMIGGEFDLSAGVMVGSSGLLLGLLITEMDMGIWPAIGLVLLFGMTIGFVNGMLVMKTKLPSFIVTLGTFFVLRGLNLGGTLSITDRVYIENIDQAPGYDWARKFFGSTFWAPYDFQIRVVWWVAITGLATWVLMRTRIGNWIFSVGGDATAARNVGVPVLRTKVGLFMTTSTFASLLGIMTAVQLRSIEAGIGIGQEFEYIIAAVVGGCLLTGGFGSAVGASIGALIMGMAIIGIPFAGWNSDWQYLFLGIILLLAVLLNTAIRRQVERARR